MEKGSWKQLEMFWHTGKDGIKTQYMGEALLYGADPERKIECWPNVCFINPCLAPLLTITDHFFGLFSLIKLLPSIKLPHVWPHGIAEIRAIIHHYSVRYEVNFSVCALFPTPSVSAMATWSDDALMTRRENPAPSCAPTWLSTIYTVYLSAFGHMMTCLLLPTTANQIPEDKSENSLCIWDNLERFLATEIKIILNI